MRHLSNEKQQKFTPLCFLNREEWYIDCFLEIRGHKENKRLVFLSPIDGNTVIEL